MCAQIDAGREKMYIEEKKEKNFGLVCLSSPQHPFPPPLSLVGANLSALVSSADALTSTLSHMKSLADGRPLRLDILPAEAPLPEQEEEEEVEAAEASAWVVVDGTGEDHGTRLTAPSDSDDSDDDHDQVAVPTPASAQPPAASPQFESSAKPMTAAEQAKQERKAARAAAKEADKAERRAEKEAKAAAKRKTDERSAAREETHLYEVAKARLDGQLEAATEAQQAAEAMLAAARQQVESARTKTKALRQELRVLKQARRAARKGDHGDPQEVENAPVEGSRGTADAAGAAEPQAQPQSEKGSPATDAASALAKFQVGNVVVLRSVVSKRSLRCTDDDGVNGLGGRGRWARWAVVGRQGDVVQLERVASDKRGRGACLRINADLKLDAAGGRGGLTWLNVVAHADGTVALLSREKQACVAVQADGSPKHPSDMATNVHVDRFEVGVVAHEDSDGATRADDNTVGTRCARVAGCARHVSWAPRARANSPVAEDAASALAKFQVGNVVVLRSVVSKRSLRCTDDNGVNGLGGRGRWARWSVAGRQGDAVQLERVASDKRGRGACLRINADLKLDAAGGRGGLTWLNVVAHADGTVALVSREKQACVAVQADGSPKHPSDMATNVHVDRFEVAVIGSEMAMPSGRRTCRRHGVPLHVMQRRVERLIAAVEGAQGERRAALEEKLNRLLALTGATATTSDEEATTSAASDGEIEVDGRPADETSDNGSQPQAEPRQATQETTVLATTPSPLMQATLNAPAMNDVLLSRAALDVGSLISLQSVKCGRALVATSAGRISAAVSAVQGAMAAAPPNASVFEVVSDVTGASGPPAIRLRNVHSKLFLRITTGGLDCSGGGGPWTRFFPLVVRNGINGDPPIIVLRSAKFMRPAFIAVNTAGVPQNAHDFASNEDALDTVACHFIPRRVTPGDGLSM
jgi:hypothetical protein